MSYDPCTEFRLNLTRRHFLQHGTTAGIGAAALSSLLDLPRLHAATMAENNGPGYEPGTPGPVHFPARAKRVIYLFQSGAPSQIDTFDYKPTLEKLNGQNLPDSVRGKQRLTGMTAGQKSFPAAKAFTKFHQHGQSGQWISDLLPFHHQIADDICIIKSMHTEAINHDPAITFSRLGISNRAGHPSEHGPATDWGAPMPTSPPSLFFSTRIPTIRPSQPIHDCGAVAFCPPITRG